eukprot:gene10709-16482_t
MHILTCWEALKHHIAAEGTLTDATLQDLNTIFERLLPLALEIIDRSWIQRISAPCGQSLYVVKGKSQAQYICIGDFCPCQFFVNSVLTGEALLCKHLLAVQIRDLLHPPIEASPVTNEQFNAFLTSEPVTAQSPAK